LGEGKELNMRIEKSVAAYAWSRIIGVTIFASIWIVVAFLLKLRGPINYFMFGMPAIMMLLFWIGGLKEIARGGNWLLIVDQNTFAMQTPTECNFDLTLEEIDHISVTKDENESARRSITYHLISTSGEEIILPREAPWSMHSVKKELVKAGVEFRKDYT
jgi:hypothetical protein